MGESIAIIIVLLMLMIFAFIFYSRIRIATIQEKQVLFTELDIIKLSQIAYYLPEVQCSFSEVTDYGCIDSLKFFYLSEIINTSFYGDDKEAYLYYRELFGIARISLETIMNDGNSQTWVLYAANRSLPSRNIIFMPTIVYDPIEDKNNFGVLKVEQYS